MSLTPSVGSITGSGDTNEGANEMKETMVDTEVTYTLQYEGKLYIVEHVPARVSRETGEQYFAPETVEHLQSIVRSGRKPDKTIETAVYEYA